MTPRRSLLCRLGLHRWEWAVFGGWWRTCTRCKLEQFKGRD